METILYATDLSENAKPALTYAHRLAQKTGAKLIALHVVENSIIMSEPSEKPSIRETDRDVTANKKKKLKDYVKSQLESKDVEIRYEVVEDSSSIHGINSMIEERNVDLVVMGTLGRSMLRELLMGSTSKGVLEQAACPVLTVPSRITYRPFRRIVYATELEHRDIVALNTLSEIAGVFDAEITVAHISTEYQHNNELEKEASFKEMLREEVNYPRLQYEYLESKNVVQRLGDFLVVTNTDLVVMLEREKKGIFQRWFHRDLVKRMEFHSSIPLLSYNEKYLARIPGRKKEKEAQI